MKTLLTLAIVSALSVAAQTQTQAPAPSPAAEKPKSETAPASSAKPVIRVVPGPAPKTYKMTVPVADAIPITQLPPATVIATVDGQQVTAGQLQGILRNLPPQVQQKAQADRKEFLSQYGALLRLVQEAKKANLDQKSPWKETIEYNTMQVLYEAAVMEKRAELAVAPEEAQKYYDANKEQYAQVKVKAIYLPFNTSPTSQADSHGKALPTEADAKVQAEDLVKQARAGADFVKLVKEYSGDPTSAAKDGDFPAIRKTDSQIPPEIRKVLFSAKQGEVTDPVRQQRGFYIFRIEETGFEPLSEVQKSIDEHLKSEQLGKWLTDLQKSVEVKMADETPAPAAGPAPAPTPAKPAPVPSASTAPPAK
jgi:peptidyl-prolyl cis-trans isomerase C